MTDQSVIFETRIYFDLHSPTIEVTCVPSDALLGRIMALGGRRELTIRAPMVDGWGTWDAGEAMLADIAAGKAQPREARFEVDPAARPLNDPPWQDWWAPLSSDEPPLMRWAAIKPGQPWRLAQ
jgi:hypothetical protein